MSKKNKNSNKQPSNFETTAFSKEDWFGKSRRSKVKKNKKNKNNKKPNKPVPQ